jgi:hypothetical protein
VPEEIVRELIAAQREINEKFTYFLLTGAGAGIALAVSQTQGAKLQVSQIPLGLAALTWGLSVVAGCLRVHSHVGLIAANVQFLRECRDMRGGLTAPAKAAETMSQHLDALSRRAWWQFQLLIWGGVFFVTWHVLEMYLRTR